MPRITDLRSYLKKKGVLVLEGVQQGGNYLRQSVVVTPENACQTLQTFNRIFPPTPSFIVLRWNEGLNNGVVEYELDQYYDAQSDPANVWIRNIGAGYATSHLITLTEIDGITGTIILDDCGKIRFERHRPESGTRNGLQIGAKSLKVTSIKKRDQAIGCQRC